jgi:hypothetical protein
MASPGGYAERQDLNYLGDLYSATNTETPLLSMLGGLNGGGAKTCAGMYFACSQPYSLSSASQDVVSEDTAANTGATLSTVTRSQETNYIQIMHLGYGASYAKLSTYGEVGAISNVVADMSSKGNAITNEVAFQRTAKYEQLAINIEYSFLQGTGQAPSSSDTAGQTAGFSNVISTNTVAAGGADLSKALIDNLLRTMKGNGTRIKDGMIFVNAFNRQQISNIYAFAPQDRLIGGYTIQQIYTDFGILGVVYDPFMPTDEVYILDMATISTMICPVMGQLMIDEPIAKSTASERHQIYLQIGLDYGSELAHGSITGTSTS